VYTKLLPMCFSRPGKAPLITPHPGYCGEELVAADPVTLSRENHSEPNRINVATTTRINVFMEKVPREV
jgi:hypothetical protein